VVTATGGSAAFTYAYAQGICNYGDSSTSISGDADITATAAGGGGSVAPLTASAYAYGIINYGSSSTSINGDAAITATATGGNAASVYADAGAYGIYNSGSTRISGDAEIMATATGGSAAAASSDAHAYGVYNNSGTVDLEKNATILATAAANDANTYAYSLYTTSGTININQAEGNPHTVKLTGDVLATGSSFIKLNLNDPGSFLRGNVVTNDSGTINFTLGNNAVWEPVYDNRNGTITYDPVKYAINKNTISSLNLAGGIVDLTWDANTRTAQRQLDITALSGTGGTLKIHSDVANSTGDSVNIGAISSEAKLNVVVNYDRSLAAIIEPTTLYTSSNYSPVTAAAGEEYLTIAGVTTENGAYLITPHFTGTNLTSLSIDASSNTKAAASVTGGQAELMQISVNHLRKRLGDLRESPAAETGVWARGYTGEVTNDKYGSVASDYRGMQMGYDKSSPVKDGRKYTGGALSYTTADNSFSRGSGDSKACDIALYHTWVGDSGHYYDLIAKHGRLSSDYHTADISGNYSSADYHTWSDSLSAEYGYRKALKNGWYLEPQAELTLGRIQGVNYTTSSGMKVRQDGIGRLIGRMGMGVGKKLTNGSHLYSSLSLLHEFNDDQTIQADTLIYNRDMGGSWYEFILGSTAKLSDHSDGYFNVEKLFGGHVGSNWQVNAGCRFNF
jgi:outer membrane autotransporter protein